MGSMPATAEQLTAQMMTLPDEDRREALLATLEISGRDFSADILDALESARRADELIEGRVQPISREQAFSRARAVVKIS